MLVLQLYLSVSSNSRYHSLSHLLRSISCLVPSPKLQYTLHHQEIKSWCRTNQVHVTITALNSKLLQLKGNSYPSLMCKGADVKLLIFWLTELLCNRDLPLSDHVKTLVATSHALARFIYLMDTYPMFLTDDQAQQLIQAGELYLNGLLRLRIQSQEAGKVLFKLRPKCHYFQCRILNRLKSGSRLNPRVMSCFHDEWFIGIISRIACQTHSQSVGLATLLRYEAMAFARRSGS